MWVFYYPSDDRQKYFLFVDLTKKVTNLESVQDTGAGDGQSLKVCSTEYCVIFHQFFFILWVFKNTTFNNIFVIFRDFNIFKSTSTSLFTGSTFD